MEISGRAAIAGAGVLLAAVLVSAYAGATFLADTTGNQQPTDAIQEFNGEFEQVGLAQADLEDPFATMNGFETITVDDQATNQELTDAEFNWTVATGTDLGLEERTAVAYHSVEDGALEDVDYELTNPATDMFDSVSAEVYNYESAVDSGEVGRAVVELDVDSEEFTAETDESVNLREGEYALVIDYKFDSAASAPGTSGSDKLHDIHIEGDSDEDDAVDTITGVPVGVTAN